MELGGINGHGHTNPKTPECYVLRIRSTLAWKDDLKGVELGWWGVSAAWGLEGNGGVETAGDVGSGES